MPDANESQLNTMKKLLFLLLLGFALQQCAFAKSVEADILLINGKVFEPERLSTQSIAIQDGRILAISDAKSIKRYQGKKTRVIDLLGKTVIPGLIDSHIHAIRAGLYFGSEVDWADAQSIPEAMGRLESKARTLAPGEWLVVAGGWTDRQFIEKRKPSLGEVSKASLGHPFYIQFLYDGFLISPSVIENKTLDIPLELFARLKVESVSSSGEDRPTGWFYTDARTVSEIFELLPKPSFPKQIEGTKSFFSELNRNAMTGVLDPGGYNLSSSAYETVRFLNKRKELTIKLRYFLCSPSRGSELADFQSIVATEKIQQQGEFYRWNGIGENVTWGMYNNENPSKTQQQELEDVLIWANNNNLTVTLHWNNDQSVHYLLDVIEKVNAAKPIKALRWSVAHLNDASEASLSRMHSLGLGWLVQDAFYYQGERFAERRGANLAEQVPRIMFAINRGMTVAMGTDAHRVMTYKPFTALQWLLTGKTAGGVVLGSAKERPSRTQALKMYSQNSAWFSFEDRERGLIQVGAKADLAVLNRDYFSMPVDEIHKTRSVLTVVEGRVVYSDTPNR